MRSDNFARRGLRALVVTIAVSLALGGTLTGVAVASAPQPQVAPTNLQRAQAGAQWLANQIKLNHGILKSFGVGDPNSTAFAVVAMRAVGVDKVASDEAIRVLRTRLGLALMSGGHDAPGALAAWIMAAVADHQDPRRFGGGNPQNNLVARLLATQRTTGADKGLFGVQSPAFDGSYRQGLALAALAAAGVPASDPHVLSGIGWLGKQQCVNGLWQAYRANTATPCPAANPNTFTGPDTNSTSLAVQGLAAWGKHPRQALVLQSLDFRQSADGGWPFVAAVGQASDPDSTALTIQALIAEGSSPTAATWLKGVHTPFTALASYQLDCHSPDNGAFFFPGGTTGNTFATVQAVPAMASKTLPVAFSSASTIVPLTPC